MVARTHPGTILLPRRQFHVVIDPRARRRRLGGWLALVFTLAALFFVMISTRIALDRNAFILQDIRDQIEVEETRYWELRLRLAELQSPERIAGIAEEMGMVYPSEMATIEVPGLGGPRPGVDKGWADLKTLLSAQP
jgi:cell division protein FtsL